MFKTNIPGLTIIKLLTRIFVLKLQNCTITAQSIYIYLIQCSDWAFFKVRVQTGTQKLYDRKAWCLIPFKGWFQFTKFIFIQFIWSSG